jgi:hypothetical protein
MFADGCHPADEHSRILFIKVAADQHGGCPGVLECHDVTLVSRTCGDCEDIEVISAKFM